MIKVIIFSFDRAMQLSLLLKSIVCFDIKKIFSISIIYSYSNEEFKNGYDILRDQHSNLDWINENRYKIQKCNFNFSLFYLHNIYWWLKHKSLRKNKSKFKEQLLDCLDKSNEQFVMFLTDDSLFTREIIFPEFALENTKESPFNNSFSLRHGSNLTGGIFQKKEPNLIQWNIYQNDPLTDWGYPFSIDGHIYQKKIIRDLFWKIIFNNPNTLEGNIATYVKKKMLFSNVFAFRNNLLIGFELNRVQQVVNNNNLDISQEELNKYFINGYSLKINYDTSILFFRPEVISLSVVKEDNHIILYRKK